MFSLQELLGQEQGNSAVDQISQNVGAEPSSVNSAIQAALPMILNGLASNAATPQGAESLDNALAQHDGGILDNIGGLASSIFGGQQQAATPAPQVDGGGILGHIFGGSQDQVAEQVGNKTGLGTGQVSQIMMFLAPIVMGYLGRRKREQGVDAGGLGGLLGGLLGGSRQSAGGLGAMATSYLDKDGDGSALDDIAGMAGGLFKK
ncbi:MAG: DUF937 domain-containing protein [Pyrinomonadaceae bacterium]